MHPSNPGLLLRPVNRLALALPVVTYVSQGQATANGLSTATLSAANIGNPAYIGTRRVIVCIQGGGNSNFITGGTIGVGTVDQMTALSIGSAGSDGVEFVSALVPSGTTGVTITLNYNSTMFNDPSFTIYNVNHSLLSSITPATGFNENTGITGLNTATVNTTTKAGGFIIAGVWAGGGAGPTITSSTETYGTPDFSSSAWMSAHANGITSNASNSVSTQAPPAGGNSFLGLTAWR